MVARRIPVEIRFMGFIEKGENEDDCWEWKGARAAHGYGQFFVDKNVGDIMAHRFSFEFFYGESTHGWVVRHQCNNPGCVNPAHLRMGTQLENARDKVYAGNGSALFTKEDIREIRRRWGLHVKRKKDGHTLTDIASDYGCGSPCVWLIVNNRTWTWLQ